MLPCEVSKTFKNTCFEVYLQKTVSGGVLQKNLFLKTIQYYYAIFTGRKKPVISSVKKLFLLVDRAVKVTCFYIEQNLFQKKCSCLNELLFLSEYFFLKHIFFLVLIFFWLRTIVRELRILKCLC